MPGELSNDKPSHQSIELRVARIGLISAVVVATCGLAGTLLTVLGTAISGYFSTRAVQDPLLIPLRATQTAEARLDLSSAPVAPIAEWTPPSSPAPGAFVVANELNLPVRLSINGAPLENLAAGASRSISLGDASARLDWEVVKETTSSGRPIGDDMGGKMEDIHSGEIINIDNLVADQPYFYLYISNHSADDCEVTVNKGWQDENATDAVVPANSDEIGLGYYKLFEDSNVTLDCDGKESWWGLQPGESRDDSFYDLVQPPSGVIYFILE